MSLARAGGTQPPPRWSRLVISLALLGVALPAMATTYRLLTPTEILLAADLVFYGTVSDIVTENRADETWTVVTFRVDELLKGFGYDPAVDRVTAGGSDEPPVQQDPTEVAPESVTLAFLGGAAAGSELLVSGAPSWRFDESFLVGAYQQEELASPLVGFRQGLWRVADEGLVDLDGSWLAVADDGSPIRAATGATTSQVMRAVQGVLAGNLTPAAAGEVDEQPGDPEGAQQGPPAAEQVEGQDTEPDAQTTPDPDASPLEAPAAAAPGSDPVQAGASSLSPLEVVYDVDDSGGPLLLREKVALAASAWTASAAGAVELSLDLVAGSRNSLRYGTEARLGPDTLSLTTVAPDGAVTAYLSAAAGVLTHTALLHELGVIIGLREGGAGVMATALSTPLDTPAEADIAELTAQSRFEPADLTRDGRVDFYDLLALAEAFGHTGVNLAGDLDSNGTVDGADIEALRLRYQFGRSEQQAPADAR